MVEIRRMKKLKTLHNHGIASIHKFTTTQYGSIEVGSSNIHDDTIQYGPVAVGSRGTSKDSTTSEYGSNEVGSDSICKDRLSELPDEILVHILSFLPIRYALRTLLLRRFGNLWTFLPTLDFHFINSLKFVNNVMKFHKSPTIDMWQFKGFHVPGIANLLNWTGVALSKNPKVLGIHFECECFGDFKLHRIFTSQSIVTLKLSGLPLNLPPRVNMGSLRRLHLCRVEMSDEELEALELGCPCLQELGVCFPYGLRKIHFTAPNIERLYLCIFHRDEEHYSLNCPNLKFLQVEQVNMNNLKLIDVSSVTHVIINNHFSTLTFQHFKILHKKFQNAKIFHLGDTKFVELQNGTVTAGRDKVCMQLEQCENKLAFQQNSWSLVALKSGLHSCLLGICRLLEKFSVFGRTYIVCGCGFPLRLRYASTTRRAFFSL